MFKKVILSIIAGSLLTTTAFAAPLTKEINNDLKNFNGRVGIYAKNLKTGRTIEYNEDMVFPTASTSKLVVALATYKYLYPTVAQDKKDLYDSDIQYMMTISDNDSFNELLDEIGRLKPDALVKVVKDLRLKKTQIHSEDAFKKYGYHSVTTPYEMAKVFEDLNNDRYLGTPKSETMKNELANSIYRDEIPRFMLTKVMHKVGELDDVLCDVGIVDDGRNQILISVYTDTKNSESYASDFIANVSAKAYNALINKK